jgi:nucleoside-diphosphate-sugar epimerase
MMSNRPGLAVVFGGRGVIGAAIVSALRREGWQVDVVTHDRERSSRPGHRFADLLDRTTLPAAVAGAHLVVQSANFPNYPFEKPAKRWTFMEFDGAGTERLVTAAEAAGVGRYLFVAGVGVTDYPTKPYYQAIQRGERAVLRASLDGVVLRPAFVFGPHDHGINKLLGWCRRGLPALPLPDGGRQQHQPVFVDDVGEAAAALCRAAAPTGVFEIGGPQRMSMKDMVATAFDIAGVRQPIVPIHAGLSRWGAGVLERLPGPVLTRAALDFVLEDFVADNERVLAATGVTLTDFEVGLRSYLSS